MSNEIRYCGNNCTKRTADRTIQVTTNNGATLCDRCTNQIRSWLEKIPDTYTTLPTFALPGAAEQNPDSKATKRATVAAPIRLDVLDLLDHRLGRKWLGTATTDDRRGVIGTLWAICSEIIDGRQLTIHPQPTVTQTCEFITRHLEWLIAQDWAKDTHAELKQLHRELNDAIGDYARPPIGRCYLDLDDEAGPCNGPLFASTYGGVRCARCHAAWDATELRRLGLALAQDTA